MDGAFCGAIFRDPGGKLSIESLPDPATAAVQVVMAIRECGICSSDVLMTAAGSPMTYALGSALGHEYAGEIVALGQEVTSCAVGDRVTALPMAGCGRCPECLAGDPFGCAALTPLMGGFSEYALAQGSYVTKLPGELSFTEGALVEPLACASQAARLAGVRAGVRVLVVGTGPIGLSAIYWSRRLGCAAVAASARTSGNAATAEAMGASAFLTQGLGFAERLGEALGGPPDVIIDCAGSPGVIPLALELISVRGTIVSTALCFDEERLVPGQAIRKQANVRFSLGYRMDDFNRSVASLAAGNHEPREMIGDSVGLDEMPDVLHAMRAQRSPAKIMVEPWR
jgi:(R,R)-butanediol dehydrogenase/meso-butanediol dehydrogenase/diacetyl reductase